MVGVALHEVFCGVIVSPAVQIMERATGSVFEQSCSDNSIEPQKP